MQAHCEFSLFRACALCWGSLVTPRMWFFWCQLPHVVFHCERWFSFFFQTFIVSCTHSRNYYFWGPAITKTFFQIHFVKTYFLISGYFAMAPFTISILGKMSIDDDMIFNSTKLITFLCITTLVYCLYRTGAVSTKSSTASPRQWEV